MGLLTVILRYVNSRRLHQTALKFLFFIDYLSTIRLIADRKMMTIGSVGVLLSYGVHNSHNFDLPITRSYWTLLRSELREYDVIMLTMKLWSIHRGEIMN